MLDGFMLLKAIGSADENDIKDCADFLEFTAETPARHSRHLGRVFLIAAVIAAFLAVTASAIGLSVYFKQQEKLRNDYHVEENQVANYKEYPVPETATDGLTILSCINYGEFYRVYAAISPISREEVGEYLEYLFSNNEAEPNKPLKNISISVNGEEWISPMPYGSDWNFPPEDFRGPERDSHGNILYDPNGEPIRRPKPEAIYRKYFNEAYDEESQAFSIDFMIYDGPITTEKPVALKACLCEAKYNEDGSIKSNEVVRELGSTVVEPARYKPLTLYFPEPLEVTNEDGDVHLIYDGMEISTTTIYLLMRSPEADYVYKYDPNMSGEELAEQAEYRERWQDLRWDIDSNIKINFIDREPLRLNGAEASQYVDGVIRGVCIWNAVETINLSNVESVSIGGQTIKVSDCRNSK